MVKLKRNYTDTTQFDNGILPFGKALAISLQWLYADDEFEDEKNWYYSMDGVLPICDFMSIVADVVYMAFGDFGEPEIKNYINLIEKDHLISVFSRPVLRYEGDFMIVGKLKPHTTEVVLWAAFLYCHIRKKFELENERVVQADKLLYKLYVSKTYIKPEYVKETFLMKHFNKTVVTFVKNMRFSPETKQYAENGKNCNHMDNENLASRLKDSIEELVGNLNKHPEQVTCIGKMVAKAKFDRSFMEAIICGLSEKWLMDKAIQIMVDTWNEYVNKKDKCCDQTVGHIPEYGSDGHAIYQKDQPLKMLKYKDIKKSLESVRDDELERRKVDEKFNKESASTDNPGNETPKTKTPKGSDVGKKKGVKQLIKDTKKLEPPKYYTLKYFRPDDNKNIVERKKSRVKLLFEKWQTSNIKSNDGYWGWLDARVSSNDFMKFFEGKDHNCNLFLSKCNTTILTIFLRCLLNHETSNGRKKEKLIEHQTHHSAKSILSEQFGAVANYEVKRLDNETIRRIKESIYILDFTLPLPPLKGGGDNDYDTSDDAIQQYSTNIDLGINPNVDVEQAVKSGVLSEGKHT